MLVSAARICEAKCGALYLREADAFLGAAPSISNVGSKAYQ